jgi:hypothetical protein
VDNSEKKLDKIWDIFDSSVVSLENLKTKYQWVVWQGNRSNENP